MRKFKGNEIVLATHNQGKIKEFSMMMEPYNIKVLSGLELGLPEPEETGKTFEENAILKARAGAKSTGKIVLADDSGLIVKALGDAPGIYSARWAGPEKDFIKAMNRINEELGCNADRRAAFICVLAMVWPDGHIVSVEGRVEGEIIWPPRGEKGFGYDPIFQPNGKNKTFAEMNADEKKTMSHRGQAFEKLIENYFV